MSSFIDAITRDPEDARMMRALRNNPFRDVAPHIGPAEKIMHFQCDVTYVRPHALRKLKKYVKYVPLGDITPRNCRQAFFTIACVCDIKGVPALVQKVSAGDVEALRNLGDQMRDKVGGVVVLADVVGDNKINILAMATKDAVAKGIHAGQIVKEVAKICGGGGGGRPDMAQAGGKDAAKLDEALQAALKVIEAQIK